MAKRYPFSRTTVVNIVTVMACDPDSAEVFNFDFALSGNLPNEKHLKAIAQKNAPNNAVVVSIADVKTTKKVLGITEEQFLEIAVELDPKTRKPIIAE